MVASGSEPSGPLDPAVAATRLAVRNWLADVEPGRAVLVGCSGGPDSMALAAATVFEGRKAGWQVGSLVVDHQLQPRSGEVADEVAARLVAMGCDPVQVARVTVGRQGGPEAAARTVRYAALREAAARQDAVVVLGHTRDDQAETALLGLARGSGVRSMAGMSPVAGIFRRPFLELTRDETAAACRAQHLETWQDPHNDDPAFARVRVRTRVLPVLERELGPGFAAALARTAAMARADADALDMVAERLRVEASGDDGSLDLAVLLGSHPALLTRVLRQAAIHAGAPAGELFAVHVSSMLRLVTAWHGQQGVDLPGHLRARRVEGRLYFERGQGG